MGKKQDPKDSNRNSGQGSAGSNTQTQESTNARPAPRLFAEGASRFVVEVIGGPLDGLKRRAPGSSLTIGRGEPNDLRLAHDQLVSSVHARIVKEAEHYWLEDLGSRNGTYIGDERIRLRTLIGPGTTFTVGRTGLEFMPQ